MPVSYSEQTMSARMVAVRDQIDSGGGPGRFEICSANYAAVLATIALGYPGSETGTVSGPTLTLAGFPRSDTSADSSGTAAVARIRTSAGVDVVTGLTVGFESGDVQLDNLGLLQGQPLTISALTFTHAQPAVASYPDGVDPPSFPPLSDGSLTAFAAAVDIAGQAPNTWRDTGIVPGSAWATRAMIPGNDWTQAEVEPTPPDVGNYTKPANDTLVNSNGAAWFPIAKRFYWFGGGHGGYPGNEVYWTDLPSLTLGRLNDPSPMERWPESPSGFGWRTTDGSPVSYHTYDGIVAVEALDSFFTVFGSPWPDGNFPDLGIWKFHILTKTWTRVQTSTFGPNTGARNPNAHFVSAYQKIAVGKANFWRWYDPFNNTLGPMPGSQSTLGSGNAVATPAGIYTFSGSGVCYFMDYANIGVGSATSVNTTTHPRIRSHARWLDAGHQWNSFFWDSTRNMVISWAGSYTSEPTTGGLDKGKQVYAIDFANDHLYEFVVSSGTWATSQSLGSFTKWQHLVDLDCYIGLNNKAETNGWMVFKPGTLTRLT